MDFRQLAAQGIILLGMTGTFEGGTISFADDLCRNIAAGDANHDGMLDEADVYIAANGLDLPEEPEARHRLPDPECMTSPIRSLNLAEGIASVMWATGFGQDYGWINADICDARGRPRHQRGVSPEPGIYFLGLPWQSRRGSSFIWGVWYDAHHIAEHIGIQNKYAAYRRADESALADA